MHTQTLPDIRLGDTLSWISAYGDETGRVTGFCLETRDDGRPVVYMNVATNWNPELKVAMNDAYLSLMDIRVVKRAG